MTKHWTQWVLAGSTVALTACGGSSSSSVSNPLPSGGDQLVIQPIQVCDNNGDNCAQVEFFQALVEKVWAQAGLAVTFLPLNQLNATRYLDVNNDEFSELSFSGSAGSFGRHPRSTRNSGPINLWFVDDINSTSGGSVIQYGNAWVGANGTLVSDDILTFGTSGRIDVVAHEIGHNLGLRHNTLGAGGANNIMSSGSDRAIPSSVDDIVPDGAQLGQLTSAQISRATSSSLLTTSAGLASVLETSADSAPDVVVTGVPDLQADLLISASPLASDLWPQPESAALPITQATVVADADAATVPEPGVSAVAWLSLGLLGLWTRKHRRGQAS